jgi:hypothetical protein
MRVCTCLPSRDREGVGSRRLFQQPSNGKRCLNGHEYAKCQLGQEGIGFQALENGFVSCDDHHRLQTICDQLGPEQIDALLRRWRAKLPHPFTPQDREAGYRYDVSVLQAEFSLTQILDRPLSGRMLFEELIRENLDLGRPDMVQLIFDRRVKEANAGAIPHPGADRRRDPFSAHRL